MSLRARGEIKVRVITIALTLAFAAGFARPAHAFYSDGDLRAVESADESKIHDLRDQELHQLKVTLGLRLPTNRQADLYFRLAELYLEAYHSAYILEGRVHEKHINAGDKENSIDHSHSRPYLNSGIKASKEVLALNIPYDKLDQIYYFLGFNYAELGDRKQSIHYFEDLVQRFPNSEFATEAYKELGDDSFDDTQYRKALGYYQQAVEKGKSDALPRIYHKLAWCYYRTKQFDLAISTMKKAIELAQSNGEKFLSLKEEALRDMAVFYTETDRSDEAIAYFRDTIHDQQFYPDMLERLGKQYERNVQPQKATQVYESLLKTNPNSEASFRVLVKLVDLDLRQKRYQQAYARIQGYTPPKMTEEDTKVAAQNLRAMVRRTATEQHEKFRKTKEHENLEVAETYYNLYLNRFLAESDPRGETPEIEMYLAELKRESGHSREASELYRKVVESKDPRYAKEAGALWTAALSEAMKKNGEGSSNATEPSAMEKEYVAAADSLQENLSGTNEGREAALRAAQVLAGYKSTQKDAIRRVKKLIEQAPKSQQALTAARLWLQIETDASSGPNADLDGLKESINTIQENTALMAADHEIGKDKLHGQIHDQDTRFKVATISKEEKDKDFGAAAQGYENYAKESTQRDVVERALASAIASYVKAGDFANAERVGEDWLKRYPKSPKAIDTLKSTATSFLIQGQFEGAAQVFERLGADNDPDALETSARIYQGIGDMPHAQAIWSRHIESFKNSPHRGELALMLAKSYEAGEQSAQSDRKAVAAYRECMASSPELNAECSVRLSDLYHRIKNEEESQALLKKVASETTKKGGALSPYVGYARYLMATRLESSRTFETLALPEDRLKKAVSQRLEFLEPLSRSYNSVVDAGGPWAVAALGRLASWAMNFADELNQIQAPATFSPKGVENFKKSLDSVAAPLRKKAFDLWAEAYRKADQFEAYSPALIEIADHLATAKSKNPFRAQGSRGAFRLAGVPADGGSDGLQTALSGVREKLGKAPQDSSAWVDYGNLLWGSGKRLLAQIAYQRALSLNPKNPAALNNNAVVALSETGAEEDPLLAAQSAAEFTRASKADEFFAAPKLNRALLLNYYRLFDKAKPLLDQVLVHNTIQEAYDGLGVSLQGLGSMTEAQAQFDKASDAGGRSGRFSALFHKAARQAASGDIEGCLSTLDDVKETSLTGFEKDAFTHLKKDCVEWKKTK